MSNDEEDISCSICGKKEEQSLVLSCEHNLCMNCAAENLIRNEVKGINSMPFVICDICQTKTDIDKNTSKEILSLGLKDYNKNNNKINYNVYSPNLNSKQNYNINNFDSFSSGGNNGNNLFSNSNNNLNSPVNIVYFNKNNNRSFNNTKKNNNYIYRNIFSDDESSILNLKENFVKSDICREHGEPLNYLCLDCLKNCICAECVIHGVHKNHEVLNIKKAYPLIYNKTQELGNNINSKLKKLFFTQKNIEQKIKDISLITKKCKSDIKQAFNEIRDLIDRKEKEIINIAENNFRDNINELNSFNNLIQNKILSLNNLMETINSTLMKKKELNLINFYIENKKSIILQSDISDINKLNIDNISNLKINIDKTSFDNIISAINSFNFEIDSYKGIDNQNLLNKGNYDDNIDLNINNNISGNNYLNNDNFSDNENNIIDKINNI